MSALASRKLTCPVCDKIIEHTGRGRQQKFCSDGCRQRAFRGRFSRNETPTKPDGQASDLNAPVAVFPISLQAKSITYKPAYAGWSDGIVGPGNVIHAEVVAGREWSEIVSASGVKGYVSRLTRRALIEGNE